MFTVAVFCGAMSLIVWLFLVLFQDTLFAPSEYVAHTEAPAKESKSKSTSAKKTSSSKSSSKPSSSSSSSNDDSFRLTKKATSAPRSTASESTFYATEEYQGSADGEQQPETAAERSTRLMRETLGISERPSPTHAIDVSLIGGGECVKPGEKTSKIPVFFSYNGATVRGKSFIDLNALLSIHRRCGQGFFKMATNPAGDVDASGPLTQMRLDELKYFFQQNGVPLEALKFPSNL